MKDIIKLFCLDFNDFVRNNFKILFLCLIIIIVIQYYGKGNFMINISVLTIHVVGDILMIISFTKYSIGEKKSGYVYLTIANCCFVFVGLIAVLQSDEGKNWQYLLGTIPFFVANLFQFLDAWDLKGKNFFNYKLTMLVTFILAIIYYKFDLVYNHVWIQIIGYSLFPIFLAMNDSPKVFLARIFSVFLMIIGILFDIYYQYGYPGVIPASSLSSFFITLIALFGFVNNTPIYINRVGENEYIIKKTLYLLTLFSK